MASAEREPITGVCGAPSGGPGGSAPGGGQGGEAPLKLNAFLFLRVQRKLQICPIIMPPPMPPPRGHNAVIGVRPVRPSVCPSVRLMSRTSALTRKQKA